LLLDRRLAAAALHDERHDGDGHYRRLFGLDAGIRRAGRHRPAGAAAWCCSIPRRRTHANVPLGSGVFLGINGKNVQPACIARAAMEGVTMGMNYGLRRLAALG